MQCEYDMALADVVAAQQALAPRPAAAPARPKLTAAGKFTRGMIGWLLFIALAVMLFTLLKSSPGVKLRFTLHDVPPAKRELCRAGLIVSSLGLAAFVALWVFGACYRRSRRPLKNGHVIARLDDAGVTVQTAYRHDTLRWDGVLDVLETGERFVLKNVGPHPVILPKRGFAATFDVDAARALLAQRVVRTAERAPA